MPASATPPSTAATRTEHDSLGSVTLPAHVLWGAQTQRAINNFSFSDRGLPEAFLRALILIKQAAARANLELGQLDAASANAIASACEHLLREPLQPHFPVDVFQTGSGTSTNMNANEVIAHVAGRDHALPIHPNDQVNMGQSSNDTIPSAIHVSAALALHDTLLPALAQLETQLRTRAEELSHIIKTGRTHLMDALPLSFSQELGGWAQQIAANRERLNDAQNQLLSLAQGGTAIGTGLNAHPHFAESISAHLARITGLDFHPAADFFSAISSQDTAVAVSGQLKTLAVSLMKIANDLRWMNSGPLAGLGEISLPALQPGSSIMPGKVNPVIPEAVAMISAHVIGNDAAIAVAGQSGNFQLNVMLPLIADRLLDSISLLAHSARALGQQVASFTVNEDACRQALSRNPILVTALNPIIGYELAASIAKEAYAQGRPIIEVAAERAGLSCSELEELLDPKLLSRGGHRT